MESIPKRLAYIRKIVRRVIGIPIALGMPQGAGNDYRAGLHFLGGEAGDMLASRKYQAQLQILPPESAPLDRRKRALGELYRRLERFQVLQMRLQAASSNPGWLDFSLQLQPIPEDASELIAIIEIEEGA